MKYVALLRGINVGGKNKVDMKTLVRLCEEAGLGNVSTYINTGNIFFDSTVGSSELIDLLQGVILDGFGLEIRVLLRTKPEIDAIVAAIPPDWVNDKEQKTDVMFLWPEVDNPRTLETIQTSDVDTLIYAPHAIIWYVPKASYGRSKMNKLVGTKLYKQMTVRNVNTVRKIQVLMSEA